MRLGSLGLGLTRGRVKPFRSFALALAFTKQQYRFGSTYKTDITALPGYANARTGSKLEQNADGSLVSFADHVPGITDKGYWSRAGASNILLGGTIDLADQSVTVSAQAYTLSFIGTGSVALSGAHVATLAGTGASDRVELTFTPAAGTLTLTVTGTVQYAGLVAGNSAGPIILTNASAVTTVAADDLNFSGAIPDENLLIFARGVTGPKTGAARILFDVGTAAAGELGFRFALLDSGQPVWYNGTVYNVGSTLLNPGDEFALGLYRAGTSIRAFVKIGTAATVFVDGTSTWPAPDKLGIGVNKVGSETFNGLVKGAFIKRGTFNDADIEAAIAETA